MNTPEIPAGIVTVEVVPVKRRVFIPLVCLALAAVTLAIYFQTHGFQYITFDDNVYVYNNPRVEGGFTISGIRWALTALYMNWHPLTWLSLMLDVQLFGLNPGPEHLVNVALHLGSTLLLFFALMRLTAKPARSAFVAAIFAVHPLHVESVAWIAERKDVLSGFFAILTLVLYAGYAKEPRLRRYVPMSLAFACSLLAKPMGVTIPFVLLVLDYWPLQRLKSQRFGKLLLEKAPLMAMSAITSVLTVMAQRSSGAVVSLETIPFADRRINALVACARYMEMSVWPVKLAVFYPLETPSRARVWSSTLLVVFLTVAAVYGRKTRPYLLVGWLWYLGMLVPVIGLVQVGQQALADRYTYLPMIGLSVALVWLFSDAVAGRFARQTAAGVAAMIALLVLAVAAYRQTAYWQSSESLYDHALDVTRRNYLIESNLGVLMSMQNRHYEAMIHFEKAVEYKPDFESAHVNLGGELLDHGRIDEAFTQLSEALRLNPEQPVAGANLGAIYKIRGNFPEARRLLEDAIRHMPENAFAHGDLCVILVKTGHGEQAMAECREALRLNPGLDEARFTLAEGLAAQGDRFGAAEEYSRLLATNPSYPGAREALKKLQ